MKHECFLAGMPGASPTCSGRLRKCHLIPRQLLKRERLPQWDDRVWVWACGGIMGQSGHHGELDTKRSLRVPFSRLPVAVLDFADEHCLEWFLEREYGHVPDA